MNAVDAVNRLAALGRRMQAKEQHLQQPVAPLHFSPQWEQVLADPLFALGTLLAATGNAPDRPAAAARPRIPGPPAHSSSFVAMPPQPGGKRGDEPGAPLNSAPAHQPDPSPGAGMRLVRRQASLLGILSANVDVNTESSPGAAGRRHESVRTREHEGAQAQDPQHTWVDEGERLGRDVSVQAGWGDATSASLDRTVRLPVSPPGRPEPFAQDAASADSMRPNRMPGAPAAAQQGGAPMTAVMHAARGDDSTGARMGMSARAAESESLQETRFLGPSSFVPPSAGIRPFEADTAPPGRNQADLREPNMPLAVDSPLDDARWHSSPDGDGAERPLSLAQIDQVLAALDDRLELMLLRLYGTSGST